MFMTSTINEAVTITLSKELHSVIVPLIHGCTGNSFSEAWHFSGIFNN